ncbi:hypothetical protein CPC16_002362 [Podila verticillata]|nr:hypothetical protein BGZ52_010636 [Haplosporangium bisporale]KAF9213240.1 hypothetical protein BGZ59_005669 [Podila verticillata]KAF9393302.1 hypothetical protein CPC16_002362 [Podila verticillata]KFH72684.1 hypothetical protein MVEG_02973 [Podila verticillata NRRL 6337]
MKFTAAVATVVSTLFLASSAQAHVTANPSVAVSGGYFQTNFRVPHGCDGNATDLVIIQIPKGVSGVKPRITVPWVTSIQMVPLDTPIVTPTGTVNTTVGSVTWANGNLPDAYYEDFGLQFKLPVMNGPLYWNVMQHCTNGGWNNWTNVPDAAGKTAGFPAAVITVANATTTGTGAGAGSTAAPDTKSGAGSLAVSGYAVLVGAAALVAMF